VHEGEPGKWRSGSPCRLGMDGTLVRPDSFNAVVASSAPPVYQWLTLVHFLAQRKHFLWDRGCIQGLFGDCVGGVRGEQAERRGYVVSETAQVELKSGRV